MSANKLTAAERLNVALVELTLELNDLALAAAFAADELSLYAFLVSRDSVAALNELLEKTALRSDGHTP